MTQGAGAAVETEDRGRSRRGGRSWRRLRCSWHRSAVAWRGGEEVEADVVAGGLLADAVEFGAIAEGDVLGGTRGRTRRGEDCERGESEAGRRMEDGFITGSATILRRWGGGWIGRLHRRIERSGSRGDAKFPRKAMNSGLIRGDSKGGLWQGSAPYNFRRIHKTS